MKKYDFTVIGTAATVTVLKVTDMPQKGKSTPVFGGNMESYENGGMGYNICAGLVKLGASVYPVLTYADGRQKEYLHHFARKYGLPEDGISDPPAGSRGTTIMIQDQTRSHMTLITDYEKRMPESGWFHPQNMEPHFFNNSKMVILTVPMAINTVCALEAVERARIPLCLSMRKDPSAFPEKLLIKAVDLAEIIFANEDETEYLMEICNAKNEQDLFAGRKLKHFVETLGERGSKVFSDECGRIREVAVSAIPSATGKIETIGAGDGYVSGFLYGYINGADVRTCAAYGSSVASFVLEEEGSVTNLPSRELMLKRCCMV